MTDILLVALSGSPEPSTIYSLRWVLNSAATTSTSTARLCALLQGHLGDVCLTLNSTLATLGLLAHATVSIAVELVSRYLHSNCHCNYHMTVIRPPRLTNTGTSTHGLSTYIQCKTRRLSEIGIHFQGGKSTFSKEAGLPK